MRLTLCILSYERADDVVAAIRSALAQTDADFDLLVSDNSVSDAPSQAIQNSFPSVRLIRRIPSLPALEHFNHCIEDIQTSHFCLFHNDDLLQPGFVRQVKMALQSHPDVAALATNALIEREGVLQAQPSFRASRPVVTLRNAVELARRYFSKHQDGIAPFPSYVYSRQHVGSLRFDPVAGKYSDVAWLLQLCHVAPLVWIREPLMIYRLHGQNDGLTESRRDRLRFLRFLKSHPELVDAHALSDYRAFVHKKLVKPSGPAVAQRFLRTHRWSRNFRWSALSALLTHTWIKWTAR